MVQVVKEYCDNVDCHKEMKGSFKVRVRFEYDSRCQFGREYCSGVCAHNDLIRFNVEANRRSLSC